MIVFQILRADHWLHTASYIRRLIDANDDALAAQIAEIEDECEQVQEPEQPPSRNRSPLSLPNIHLGSAQKSSSLNELQEIHNAKPVFKNFTKRLQVFLSAQPDAGKDVAQKVNVFTMVCSAFLLLL